MPKQRNLLYKGTPFLLTFYSKEEMICTWLKRLLRMASLFWLIKNSWACVSKGGGMRHRRKKFGTHTSFFHLLLNVFRKLRCSIAIMEIREKEGDIMENIYTRPISQSHSFLSLALSNFRHLYITNPRLCNYRSQICQSAF